MKAADLRQLTDDELRARVLELRDHLFNVRIKHATGQLDNNVSVRTARRDVARALTIVAQRGQAG